MERPVIIVVFDPGGTTGCIVMETDSGEILHHEQFPMWQNVSEVIFRFQPKVVLCEDFRLFIKNVTSLANSVLLPVKVIGVIQYLCECYGLDLVMQMPTAQKAPLAQKSVFKTLNTHEKSAYLHARYFCLRHKYAFPQDEPAEQEQ